MNSRKTTHSFGFGRSELFLCVWFSCSKLLRCLDFLLGQVFRERLFQILHVFDALFSTGQDRSSRFKAAPSVSEDAYS